MKSKVPYDLEHIYYYDKYGNLHEYQKVENTILHPPIIEMQVIEPYSHRKENVKNFERSLQKHCENQKIKGERLLGIIEKEGYTAWHIVDGCVRGLDENPNDIYNRIDRLDHQKVQLTWFSDNKGLSNSIKHPLLGEKIVLIQTLDMVPSFKPYLVHCYEVLELKMGISVPSIILQKIDVKELKYNSNERKYKLESIKPKITKFEKFINKLFGISPQL